LNSLTAPAGVMQPIWLASVSENHKFPSGPSMIPYGPSARGRNRELGDEAGWRDPADLIGSILAEPQVPVGTANDSDRPGIRGGRRELDKTAIGRIEPPDLRGLSQDQRPPSGPAAMI
jgi:hypothetical protein